MIELSRDHLLIDNKPVDWVNNKFVPVEELFPNWITAAAILADFCQRTADWDLMPHPFNPTVFYSGLIYPFVVDESGTTVPMYETFPPEDKPKVMMILDKMQLDYSPRLDRQFMSKITPATKGLLLAKIKNREQSIVRMGGRPILEEMKFRLGLDVWNETNGVNQ